MSSTTTWNPSNPHVFNDAYFSNITSLSFQQTGYSIFHRLNNLLAAIFGSLISILLIYLIIFRTPKYFRHFSWMLLLSSLSDVYFIFGNFWCQSRFRISNGSMLFSMTGPAALFNYQIQCHSTIFQTTSQAMSYLILPIQYHYRYSTIKKKAPPTLPQVLFYVFLSIGLSSICGYNGSRAMCQFTNPEHVDFGQFWFEELQIPQLIVGQQSYFYMNIHNTYFTSIAVLSYILAIFYARRTVVELNKQSDYLSIRTRALQKQFGMMLLGQSILPLAVTILPIALATFLLMLNVGTGYMGEYIMQSITWFPFLNSSCTLLFVAPYRQTCQKMLLPCCNNKLFEQRNPNSILPNNESTPNNLNSIENRAFY